jgi:hypothetical protein
MMKPLRIESHLSRVAENATARICQLRCGFLARVMAKRLYGTLLKAFSDIVIVAVAGFATSMSSASFCAVVCLLPRCLVGPNFILIVDRSRID